MEHTIGTIREFKTANFRVTVDAIEDYGLDLSFDDTGKVREKLESGEYVAFTARARVFYKGAELASDYLGGCIYSDLESFADHRECGKLNREYAAKGDKGRCGSYFSDMIGQVIKEARSQLKLMQSVRVRA